MSTTEIATGGVFMVGATPTVVLPGSTATLDKSAVPYASASISIVQQTDGDINTYLDPLSGTYRTLNVGPTPRPFTAMLIRRRTVNYDARTISLDLGGLECILQDYAPLTDDYTPFGLASSLRAVVNYVLGTASPVSALEAGGPDANVTPAWDAVNYVLNPTLQASGNWAGLNCTVAYNTGGVGALGSTGYGQGNASTTTNFGVWAQAGGDGATAPKSVREDDEVFTSIYVRSPDTGVTAYIRLAWFGKDNQPIGYTDSASQTLTGGFAYFSVGGKAPRGATNAGLFIAASAATTAKAIHWDLALITDGPWDPGFFSGASTDTAAYDYTFSGTSNASQSNRKSLLAAPEPDALTWKAGVTAWDFLMPLTSQSNRMLWADETGKWYLNTPASRKIATTLTVLPSTASRADDTMDLDDREANPTGVIVRYVWTSRSGVVKTRADTAGTAVRPVTVEFAKAWPGPGAAAAILARRTGTGRTQSVEAVAQWTATPGMQVDVQLDGASDTSGTLVAVSFDLETGFMQMDVTGMVDP